MAGRPGRRGLVFMNDSIADARRQVDDVAGIALDPVVVEGDVARLGADADAHAPRWPAGLAHQVADDVDALGLAPHVDADALVGTAVEDPVAFEAVAVARERLDLVAEQDAD